jgi:hypothetical protein
MALPGWASRRITRRISGASPRLLSLSLCDERVPRFDAGRARQGRAGQGRQARARSNAGGTPGEALHLTSLPFLAPHRTVPQPQPQPQPAPCSSTCGTGTAPLDQNRSSACKKERLGHTSPHPFRQRLELPPMRQSGVPASRGLELS